MLALVMLAAVIVAESRRGGRLPEVMMTSANVTL
jgi:hypothetical protein